MLNAIIGHLVGDYLLQNDWMALNKKSKILPCFVHCAIWTISVCLFGHITSIIAILILFCTHFLQDHTKIINKYMSLMGQNQFMNGACSPWSVIVVDNVWHMLVIWFVYTFII